MLISFTVRKRQAEQWPQDVDWTEEVKGRQPACLLILQQELQINVGRERRSLSLTGEGHPTRSCCVQEPILWWDLAVGQRLKGQAEGCPNLFIVGSGTPKLIY